MTKQVCLIEKEKFKIQQQFKCSLKAVKQEQNLKLNC